MTTYSNKIISLHLDKCKNFCPNKDVCYLLKRESNNNTIYKNYEKLVDIQLFLPGFKSIILDQGFKVYDSICGILTSIEYNYLQTYPNYNITISFNDVKDNLSKIIYYENQINVSIYTLEQALQYPGQKLFLIKDKDSELLASKLVKYCNNIHFNISDTYESLFFYQSSSKNITIDSCYSGWVKNGECPYKTDYIDISYDHTIRRCPFEKIGTKIPKNFIINNNYIDLFKLAPPFTGCGFSKEYKRKPNG